MAKNKFTLPFVVAPRREPITEVIGTEEGGSIEIQRKGYLTVAEKSFMQQATTGDETITRLHRLAAVISRKEGVQPQEVLEALSAGDISSDMFADHLEEISEVIGLLNSAEVRRKAVAVTCLIYFRISEEWDISKTMDLHPELIDALYTFYTEEDTRSTEAFEAEDKEEDLSEGK